MFRRFLYQFRTHQLASQICQIRTDLRTLANPQVIDHYLEDELLNRRAAADLGRSYPMSTLYRRVLLHMGDAPKAVYVEQVYQLQRICQQQGELIQTSAENRGAMQQYENELLSTADGLLQQLLHQEANQQVNAPVRRN